MLLGNLLGQRLRRLLGLTDGRALLVLPLGILFPLRFAPFSLLLGPPLSAFALRGLLRLLGNLIYNVLVAQSSKAAPGSFLEIVVETFLFTLFYFHSFSIIFGKRKITTFKKLPIQILIKKILV